MQRIRENNFSYTRLSFQISRRESVNSTFISVLFFLFSPLFFLRFSLPVRILFFRQDHRTKLNTLVYIQIIWRGKSFLSIFSFLFYYIFYCYWSGMFTEDFHVVYSRPGENRERVAVCVYLHSITAPQKFNQSSRDALKWLGSVARSFPSCGHSSLVPTWTSTVIALYCDETRAICIISGSSFSSS